MLALWEVNSSSRKTKAMSVMYPLLLIALAVAVTTVTTGPVAKKQTQEDAFFNDLAEEERYEIIRRSLGMLQNGVPRLPELDLSQSRAGGAADDLDSEPLGGQSSEKADQFALQMALWIDNTYKLSQHQIAELLEKGETCTHDVCLNYGNIGDLCCPFG